MMQDPGQYDGPPVPIDANMIATPASSDRQDGTHADWYRRMNTALSVPFENPIALLLKFRLRDNRRARAERLEYLGNQVFYARCNNTGLELMRLRTEQKLLRQAITAYDDGGEYYPPGIGEVGEDERKYLDIIVSLPSITNRKDRIRAQARTLALEIKCLRIQRQRDEWVRQGCFVDYSEANLTYDAPDPERVLNGRKYNQLAWPFRLIHEMTYAENSGVLLDMERAIMIKSDTHSIWMDYNDDEPEPKRRPRPTVASPPQLEASGQVGE